MKWLVRVVLAVIVLMLAVAGGGYVWLRGSLPRLDGTVAVAGLSNRVNIVRDRNAIPHIIGKTAADTAFGLGFAHAQDRLWQMEMNRRVGAGRLSEIFGDRTVGTDRFLRTLGVYKAAETAYTHLTAEAKTSFDAYAAGVNAYLETRSGPLPVEFLVFRHKPEPWKPTDSLVWLKMMAWDLGGNWRDELLRLRMSRQLTPQQISELYPPYPGERPKELPDFASLYRGLEVESLWAEAPMPLPEGTGSNNWVVNGDHAATGKPLLANDPHLGLAAPAIWYFAHLSNADGNVIGASLPGVPGIILGRNDRIAWGFTNTGPDTQDLYIEKIDPEDPNRYLTPDGSRPFDIREETIRVKGGDDIKLRVRSTRHGPVISDAHGRSREAVDERHVLAFAWTALLDQDMTPNALPAVGRAGNWAEFVDAARSFHAPQQNMVYADVDGNIGFYAPGLVPIRRADNEAKGMVPVPGWSAKYDWIGFIPFEDLPHSHNPDVGKLFTANHKIVPPGYPYHITFDWAAPYRAQRIDKLLNGRTAHSLDSFKRMQGDVQSVMVADFVPLLLRTKPADENSGSALEMLRQWNMAMDADRPEPLVFAAWLRELTRSVYADELAGLFRDYWGLRPLFMYNVLRDHNGQARWCDDVATTETETCDERLSESLSAALADLSERYGADMEKWRWGDAHFAHSDHRPFSGQPIIGDLFDIKVPSGGGTYTVNVGRFSITDTAHPYANVHAPSLRAIYDLSDPNRSIFIHSTGQSGNRLSPYYASFVEAWRNIEYVPMTTKPSDFEAGAIGTLVLQPER